MKKILADEFLEGPCTQINFSDAERAFVFIGYLRAAEIAHVAEISISKGDGVSKVIYEGDETAYKQFCELMDFAEDESPSQYIN